MFNKKQYRLDKKNKNIFKNVYNFKIINKNFIILKNNKTLFLVKTLFLLKVSKLTQGNLNICSITGKYKTTFNSLKLSRHAIKKFGDTCNLPNYSKLSW